jgi:flavin reductase (DIM6/NTAB) family NADH-FMN oxidoreductase RutF
MKTFHLSDLSVPETHHLLLGSVGPRPICFASTIDAEGRRNLAPFSFFNVFSANPPIAVFSPARSGRTGHTKNTYDNVKEVPEVVINIVNYDMVHQTSLASSPYEKGVDEFKKAGFTPVKSETVKPYRVKESPVQMECEVIEVKELGDAGGSGNLVICKVKVMHFHDDILNDMKVDQQKIDLVARMGGNYYCRAHGDALFEIAKPITTHGIGVDSLPESVRYSSILTGNHLGQLGNLEHYPTESEIDELGSQGKNEWDAVNLIEKGKILEALCVLLKSYD